MERKKFVFQLDTPYSSVSWPQIAPENQDAALDLLCEFLSPLGHFRSKHIQLSKGKRAKKRKRKEANLTEVPPEAPPKPAISSYVDVGFATVTRCLQTAAAGEHGLASPAQGKETAMPKYSEPVHYSTIFVARSGQPGALNSHLPQMVAAASKAHASRVPIRLVGLSKACEDRLSESIGIPRVSCIGIREDAPNSKALVDFIRQHVPIIEISWLQEARKAEYKETKINAIQTTIGQNKRTA